MNSKSIIGKTITGVLQSRSRDNNDRAYWSLTAIEFSDKSVLRFVVVEEEADYGIHPVYPARPITPEERAIARSQTPALEPWRSR